MYFRSSSLPILWVALAFGLTACQKLSPQQAHFEKGFKAYNQGDFSTALLYLKPLVDSGHPAAQLLVAKMYANGQGVTENMEKAELLRNLAAFQIYKKKDLTPGEVRPANETLKSISDRLDYYVGAQEGNKGNTQDLSKVMQSVDIKGLADLQNIDGEQGSDSGHVPVEVPHEPIPGAEPEPSRTESSVSPSFVQHVAKREKVPVGDARGSEQITLGLVQQAAAGGDIQAMELLCAAYTNGFYGLTPNAAQALLWKTKVKETRHYKPLSSDIDPVQQVPWAQIGGIVSAGMALIAVGFWRWRQTRLR